MPCLFLGSSEARQKRKDARLEGADEKQEKKEHDEAKNHNRMRGVIKQIKNNSEKDYQVRRTDERNTEEHQGRASNKKNNQNKTFHH